MIKIKRYFIIFFAVILFALAPSQSALTVYAASSIENDFTLDFILATLAAYGYYVTASDVQSGKYDDLFNKLMDGGSTQYTDSAGKSIALKLADAENTADQKSIQYVLALTVGAVNAVDKYDAASINTFKKVADDLGTTEQEVRRVANNVLQMDKKSLYDSGSMISDLLRGATVVNDSDGNPEVLDRDGNLIWTKNDVGQLQTSRDIFNSPAPVGGGHDPRDDVWYKLKKAAISTALVTQCVFVGMGLISPSVSAPGSNITGVECPSGIDISELNNITLDAPVSDTYYPTQMVQTSSGYYSQVQIRTHYFQRQMEGGKPFDTMVRTYTGYSTCYPFSFCDKGVYSFYLQGYQNYPSISGRWSGHWVSDYFYNGVSSVHYEGNVTNSNWPLTGTFASNSSYDVVVKTNVPVVSSANFNNDKYIARDFSDALNLAGQNANVDPISAYQTAMHNYGNNATVEQNTPSAVKGLQQIVDNPYTAITPDDLNAAVANIDKAIASNPQSSQARNAAVQDAVAAVPASAIPVNPVTDIPGYTPSGSEQTGTPNYSTGDYKNYTADLHTLFPFCLPWDLYALLAALDADPVAPVVDYPIKVLDPIKVGGNTGQQYVIDYTVHVDLGKFDSVAKVFRLMMLVSFIILLIFATSKLIKW